MYKLSSATRLAVLTILVAVQSSSAGAAESVAIGHDRTDPRVAFAVKNLHQALRATGSEVVPSQGDWTIVFDTFQLGLGPQSFRIRREGKNVIRVVGGDSLGAMYGGLELAEMIALGNGLAAVEEKARKPYVFRRGIKFNIPFDGRAPSYDDTGTSVSVHRLGNNDGAACLEKCAVTALVK